MISCNFNISIKDLDKVDFKTSNVDGKFLNN
jgi:hypothetical protein